MVYVMGIVGFVGGFAFGQMLLYFLLRHRSRQDLLHDKTLRMQYGITNWACAILGAYGLIQIYRLYFGP